MRNEEMPRLNKFISLSIAVAVLSTSLLTTTSASAWGRRGWGPGGRGYGGGGDLAGEGAITAGIYLEHVGAVNSIYRL